MLDSFCYIFVALHCEAKPLIKYFKLKKQPAINAFSIYRNTYITLTVTGVGKVAMASAIGYSLALFPCVTLPVLLNIGIAGHSTCSIGSIFAAEKIIDQETGRRFYPQLVSTPPCLTHTMITVSKPQLDYTLTSLYEMEASAFYATAIRFSCSELIQCIKVISDNQYKPLEQIKPAKVSLWLQGALPIIDKYIRQLGELARLVSPVQTAHFAEIMTQWHFSSHEKLQLKSLLDKRAILMPHQPLDLSCLSSSSGKVILHYLRKQIDEQAFGGF